MSGSENKRIIRNRVTLEKYFIIDDDFLELSLQRKIFSQRMLNDIMRSESPSLNYCMKLFSRGQDAFARFINILV